MRIAASDRLASARDCTLAELLVGDRARILGVDGNAAAKVATHGLRKGSLLVVEHDAPFGGPRIVRLGAARIALARSLARSIRVRPEPSTPGTSR
jgi:Fe2+ transport system protein FeoA